MKKILALTFVLLSVNLFCIDLYLGGAVNYGNEWNPKATPISKTDYDNEVYSVNLELTQVLPILEIGAGVAYEKGYKLGAQSYDAIPVYGLLKVNLFPIGVKPYLVAKYGTTIYAQEKNISIDNGAYYSAGLGLTLLKRLQLEATYSLGTGKSNGKDLYAGKGTLSLKYNIRKLWK